MSIKVAERFVQEENIDVRRDGAGQGGSLRFAA
jgi:hypothetical protein